MTATITLTADQVQSVLTQDGTVATMQAQVTQLTSDKAALQVQLDAANTSVSSLNAKITAAKNAAQSDKDADAANAAGQGVLDALA
jgi:hypothetical protein